MKVTVSDLFDGDESARQILETIPAAVYITDTAGNLKYYNSAAAELSGREPQLDSDRWCVSWKLYYPDKTPMPHEESPMAVCLKEGRSLPGRQGIMERPDGECIWIKVFPAPLKNREGEISGGINIIVDITEQKEREDQLRVRTKALNRSEEKYHALFEKMGDGFCIIQMEYNEEGAPVDFRYLETNPAFEKHTGISDLEGENVSDVLPGLEKHWFRRYGEVGRETRFGLRTMFVYWIHGLRYRHSV